jgi:hypothetical protein
MRSVSFLAKENDLDLNEISELLDDLDNVKKVLRCRPFKP